MRRHTVAKEWLHRGRCVSLPLVGGFILRELRPVGTLLPMVAQFSPLAEAHGTHWADEGLLARVSVLMFLLVLRKREGLGAEATRQFLLRVVLLVVAAEGKLCAEDGVAPSDVALKNGRLLFLRCTGLA